MYPLASLLATEQVMLGDVLSIDWDGTSAGLKFLKEAEGALLPVDAPVPEGLTEAAAAAIPDGREITLPAATTASAKTPSDARPSSMQAHRGIPSEKAKNEKR